MNLSFRPAACQDCAEVYHSLFCHDRENFGLRAIVASEWEVFIGNPATLSMVVEDRSQSQGRRIVGFAQTVFVTDAFVACVCAGLPPHLNQHATRSMMNGFRPLLSLGEVREANRAEGLNALTTRWGWTEEGVNEEEQLEIREYMDRTYPQFYRGYHYKHLLIETTGEWSRQSMLFAGYRIVNAYTCYFNDRHSQPPPHRRPCLLGVSRTEALAQEGTLVSRLFAHSKPRFLLKPAEQALLWHAVLGRTDREISALFDRTEHTIKKRWSAIYERVGASDPWLLPTSNTDQRGEEKRKILLQYVQNHLEELRPTEALPDAGNGKFPPKSGSAGDLPF